ncbi:C40 family peptidase [Alteribacter aurantiacus]|uniref:C40 family peptidase n=1 Tax=Alteribacter aurantiacus TaxID=254410 RepID=UPI000407EF02|nr:NlpC/P60 family protein [Alteribacter aurantiacus]
MDQWIQQYKWALLLWTSFLLLLVLLFKPWETSTFDTDVSFEKEHIEKDYGELNPDVEEIIELGKGLMGTPFHSGGNNPEKGFNSSGFVQYIYKEATGIRMPRLAAHQYDLGKKLSKEELYPGDLVFFEGDTIMSGVYTGHGEFLVVSQSNGVEQRSLFADGFWSEHFIGGKRMTDEDMRDLHPSTYTDHPHPIIREAIMYLDTPYVFGGNTTNGFDCSFFIQQVLRESSEIYLPRVTKDQFQLGEEIDKDDIKPGDVLFFSGVDTQGNGNENDPRMDWDVNHVGIYVGGEYMIHASRTEKMTQLSFINDYWGDAFVEARRYDHMSLNDEFAVVQEASTHLFSKDFTTPGFVKHVYEKSMGITIPTTAEEQWNSGSPVNRDHLEIGDILFFQGSNSYLSALYIGHDLAMFASSSAGVTIRHLDYDEFFKENYLGARRGWV